ncbi:MAG TPA: DUF488 family protein [Methylocystis sp.]|nr:DUF488 family protein [Methylocystis sp.]
MRQIQIKRVYEPPVPEDGRRILVDRIWPRGLSRVAARVDYWLKEVAPSDELRRWFNHDPARWREFRGRYRVELANCAALAELQRMLEPIPQATLLFAAKDVAHNNAVVLREELTRRRAALERPDEPRAAPKKAAATKGVTGLATPGRPRAREI